MLSTLVNKRESAAALLTKLGRDAKMLHKRGKEREREVEKRGLAIFLPAGSFCVTKIKSTLRSLLLFTFLSKSM